VCVCVCVCVCVRVLACVCVRVRVVARVCVLGGRQRAEKVNESTKVRKRITSQPNDGDKELFFLAFIGQVHIE
jgi:hypothetical protein